MSARLGWLQGTEIALFVAISLGAVALTIWQTSIDRSVFERYFGALNPIGVMTGASMVGVIAIVWLQQHSAFRMVGPNSASGAVTIIAWVVPVALLEAILQAAYATSIGTAVFSAAHLTVFGLVQVWIFWRFGFVWMLGFRLAYYSLWHVAWGVARLELLF